MQRCAGRARTYGYCLPRAHQRACAHPCHGRSGAPRGPCRRPVLASPPLEASSPPTHDSGRRVMISSSGPITVSGGGLSWWACSRSLLRPTTIASAYAHGTGVGEQPPLCRARRERQKGTGPEGRRRGHGAHAAQATCTGSRGLAGLRIFCSGTPSAGWQRAAHATHLGSAGAARQRCSPPGRAPGRCSRARGNRSRSNIAKRRRRWGGAAAARTCGRGAAGGQGDNHRRVEAGEKQQQHHRSTGRAQQRSFPPPSKPYSTPHPVPRISLCGLLLCSCGCGCARGQPHLRAFSLVVGTGTTRRLQA